jgi:hypothetical protein
MSWNRNAPVGSWGIAQWPPPVVQYEEPAEILADALLDRMWCAAWGKVLPISHLDHKGCLGPHYTIVVDELIEDEPEPVHTHSPQLMFDLGGVPNSVCCTGIDGCGLNDDLSKAWALPGLGGV